MAQEAAALARVRDAAIAHRDQASLEAISIDALNGQKSLFVGAYIHAHRPDWQLHEYGVVIDLWPSACVIAQADAEWESRVNFKKYEVDVFDNKQWEIVVAELRQRAAAVKQAEKAGKKKQASNLQGEFERTPVSLAL